MCKYVQGPSDLISNCFKAAGITEVVQNANEVFRKIEKPFIFTEVNRITYQDIAWYELSGI